MVTNLRLVFAISIFFLCFYGFGQDDYWKESESQITRTSKSLQKLSVKQAKVYNLEEEKFKQNLSALSSNSISKKIIYFPDESGKIEGFEVIESSVFSEELARTLK